METHLHCDNCVLAGCKQTTHCPIEHCPEDCGISTHQCKIPIHLAHTCPEALEQCPNNKAGNGCTETMKRRLIAEHVQHCVASVVQCRFSHQRIEQPIIPLPEWAERKPDPEALIDAKFADGDLSIWENGKLEVISNSANQTTRNFWAPKLVDKIRLKKAAASNIEESSNPDYITKNSDKGAPILSLDTNVGLMNIFYWVKDKLFSSEVLQNCRRSCIDTEITNKSDGGYGSYRDPYAGNLRHTHRSCTFVCNGVVRRDEFSDHWKTMHLDIQLTNHVQRCPMRLYGCNHGVLKLQPTGAELDFDKDTDSFLVKCPTTITPSALCDEAELQRREELALYGYEFEDQQLGQLPAEVLILICGHLDSQSLWMLSQVSHYMREVCVTVAKKFGIAYYRWEKEAPGGWTTGTKITSFSKSFSGVSSWTYTNEPTVSAHMMSCDLLAANRKTYTNEPVMVFPFLKRKTRKKRKTRYINIDDCSIIKCGFLDLDYMLEIYFLYYHWRRE